MFLSVASSIMLAALSSSVPAAPAVSTPVHSARIDHASNAYTAAYRTQSTLHLTQVNGIHAMRDVRPICRWKADVVLHRTLEGQGAPVAALTKPIHQFAPLSGTFASNCEHARSQIEAQIARHGQAHAGEAAVVAQQDRAVLARELDGIHAMTVKG